MTILQSYEHRIKLDFLLGISTDRTYSKRHRARKTKPHHPVHLVYC